MKILFMDWKCLGREDLLEVFRELGHIVVHFSCKGKEKVLHFEMEYIEKLSDEIEEKNIDLAFSMNYYPSVSEACQGKGIPYIAWVYDSPYAQIYGINIINDCNFIFTFNRYTYNQLIKKGVKTIYYSPLAANTKRFDKMYLSNMERKKYGADISFVGSFYNETDNVYQILSEQLQKNNKWKTLGYMNGIIDAQLKVYGHNFFESILLKDIVKDIRKIYDYDQTYFTYFAEDSYVISWVLTKRVTELERTKMLIALSKQFEVKVFTHNEKNAIGNCVMNGYTDYYVATPKVFKASKINLNMTLKSIETGIPFRAIEIMGAGGFLLTNYQEDFLLHFEPNRDFVYYESEDDLLEKASYYLKNNTERKKIARNGYKRIVEDFTYQKRIKEMIWIATKNK